MEHLARFPRLNPEIEKCNGHAEAEGLRPCRNSDRNAIFSRRSDRDSSMSRPAYHRLSLAFSVSSRERLRISCRREIMRSRSIRDWFSYCMPEIRSELDNSLSSGGGERKQNRPGAASRPSATGCSAPSCDGGDVA